MSDTGRFTLLVNFKRFKYRDPGRVDTDLVFKGHTPGSISCADFVRAVRKHAVIEKKSRDDEYIADCAMSCFTDDAFYWSENLTKEVQEDWSLLRRALVEEYGSSDRVLSPVVWVVLYQ